jgi:suppressor of ftsI
MRTRFGFIAGLDSFTSLLCVALIGWLCIHSQQMSARDPAAPAASLPMLPEARSPISLTAINNSITGRSSFLFDGNEVPPVIRTSPGEDIRVTYLNAMTDLHQLCSTGPCGNMTNLHFHGLHVSPDAPQDDVISMMAMPGQTLQYRVSIPDNQPPGLYWYHPHPHGESYKQVLDGMSGAIVIDGMERYVPEVAHIRERVLVLRDQVLPDTDSAVSSKLQREVALSESCGSSVDSPKRIFTVNGVLRPQISIATGERQFWRIVNASPDLYADLQVDQTQLEIIALDGMPLAFHDPKNPARSVDHILLPPAGRVEAIVTGPKPGTRASLRSRCFDTGPDGDPNPAMVLADLANSTQPNVMPSLHATTGPLIFKPLSAAVIAHVEGKSPDFHVVFSEDKNGFYINGKKYSPSDPPLADVETGAYYHWRITNNTNEVHPFHIHQVHFLVYSQDGVRLKNPGWLDTANVPVHGSIDLMMDFTDPIIRGLSLFHCHLMNHEDKGMMATIRFR